MDSAPSLFLNSEEDHLHINVCIEHPSLINALSPSSLAKLIQAVFTEEKVALEFITLVLVTDAAILKLNQEHLNHDYYTDILTFPYDDDPVQADLFVSWDTVQTNATKFESEPYKELQRVVIHGCLHLCGYDDKSEADRKRMRDREDFYLARWNSLPS